MVGLWLHLTRVPDAGTTPADEQRIFEEETLGPCPTIKICAVNPRSLTAVVGSRPGHGKDVGRRFPLVDAGADVPALNSVVEGSQLDAGDDVGSSPAPRNGRGNEARSPVCM
jgi:hypothetical protein